MKFLTHRFPAPATRLLLSSACLLLAAFGAGCSDNDNNLNPLAVDNTAPVGFRDAVRVFRHAVSRP